MTKLVRDEVDYRLTKSSARGGRMPKRGSPLELIVNGSPVTAKVTSNAGWCVDPALVIEYIWIELEDGSARYVTLGYGEKAESWKGAEVAVVDGAGPKPVDRLADKVDSDGRVVNLEAWEREAGRIAKFKMTFAARG